MGLPRRPRPPPPRGEPRTAKVWGGGGGGKDVWDGRDAMGDGYENSKWCGCGTQNKYETKKRK